MEEKDKAFLEVPEASVLRGVLAEGQARIFVVQATPLVQRLREIHGLSRLAVAALGRLSMGAMMMAADQKIEGTRVMLRMEGKGPLGGVVADADARGGLRGYVENPSAELPLKHKGKLDVSGGIGIPGLLTVVKDIRMKEPTQTSLPLVTAEVAEDLAAYYVQSEQIPSAVGLGVLVDGERVRGAGGYLIQLLPDAEEAFIAELEKVLKGLPPVSSLAEEYGNPEDLFRRIGGTWKAELLGKEAFSFSCNCSRDLAASLIKASLSKAEVPSEAQELCCRFCNTSYLFPLEECARLMAEEEEQEA